MRDNREWSWPGEGGSASRNALASGMPAAKPNLVSPHVYKVQAAILSADVAGFSRLLATDEWATVATLEAYRAVFHERVARENGRVVDTAGDSVLAIFSCPMRAVEAAFAIQEEIGRRNKMLPKDLRMRFRIGINFGGVIVKHDGMIYGLDVNIAAHLESLAEPGGMMVSESVYRRVMGKTGRDFADAGEHRLKNTTKLVRAFSAAPRPAERKSKAMAWDPRAHA